MPTPRLAMSAPARSLIVPICRGMSGGVRRAIRQCAEIGEAVCSTNCRARMKVVCRLRRTDVVMATRYALFPAALPEARVGMSQALGR